MADKTASMRLDLKGGDQVAREADLSAKAIGSLGDAAEDLAKSAKSAGGNGKALAADMENVEHAVKKTNGEAARASKEISGVGSAAAGAGRLLRGLRDSFGEITAYTGVAYKALKVWLGGVAEARKAAAEDVILRVSVKYLNETPEQAGERFERLAKKTERIALELGVDPGEVQKGAASVIDSPQTEAAILEGGLGRVGAQLGVETGMGAAGGMSYLKRQAKTWGTDYSDESMQRHADILTRYSKTAGVSPGEFGGTMEKLGLGFSAVGARPEDAALLASSLMSVRPGKAGPAIEAFSDALTAASQDPKKRALMRRHGLDLTTGGPEEWQGKFDAFFKKTKDPNKRTKILNELYGPSGGDIGYLFESGAIASTRANVANLPGSGAVTEERKKTSDYWIRRGKGTLGEGVEDAFSGPEALAARAGAFIVPKVAEPLRGFMGTDAGQITANGLLLGTAGVAAGLGGRALWKSVQGRGGIGGMWRGVADEAGDTTAGVGKGLVVSAITGGKVQPVFVTNWPRAFGDGGGTPGEFLDSRGRQIPVPPGGGPSAGSIAKGGLSIGSATIAVSGGIAIASAVAPVIRAANAWTEENLADDSPKGKVAAFQKLNPMNMLGHLETGFRAGGQGLGWLLSAITGDEEGKKLYGRSLRHEVEQFEDAWRNLNSDASKPLADAAEKHSTAADVLIGAAQLLGEKLGAFEAVTSDLKIASTNIARGK